MGMASKPTTIRIDPRDNVAVAMCALTAGMTFDGLLAGGDIAAGHKVAIATIHAGQPVLKAGAVIGLARHDIGAGNPVRLADVDPATGTGPASALAFRSISPPSGASFQGYVRADGRVGTRNTLGVFVVGNCGATAARHTADWFDSERLADYRNVDAVVPYVHELGCGMEMTGEPMDLLRRTISGYIRNPNTAAAVVIALGCERNNLRGFLEQEKLAVGDRLRTVTIQEVGGIKAAIDTASGMIREMLPEADRATRTAVGAEHLTLGLKAGAPDGFCGLSANPALGAAVDLLVAAGGTAILSETPDLLAGMSSLSARTTDKGVAERLAERSAWWRQYGAGKDIQLNGRIGKPDEAAGLLSLAEKAFDALGKSGSAPLSAAYRYGEVVDRRGLVFMDTPSYDPVAVTGQIAGGANLVALTTGTGSVFGSLPAPTVKIASNSDTSTRMADDTDIDCGPVLRGEADVPEMGRRIFEQLLRHASGEKTKAEVDGVGENEFVPWPIGVLA